MQGVRDNEAIHARPSEPTAETRQRMDIGKPLLRFISLAYPKCIDPVDGPLHLLKRNSLP